MAVRAAAIVIVVSGLAATARAQQWNDPRAMALVDAAIARRAAQLADTGLAGYKANAHGFLTFLAQMGDQLDEPPKVVRTDELAVEVYWRAPNLSKQRIVGRRDTLLLPTDIEYHQDHLAIVQNNFPGIIRLGNGDEVQDVPHPLSAAGRTAYDFAATDSFTIRTIDRTFQVIEVKVRPRNDRQPRAVGALYLDKSTGVVVRMAFSFTRAALKDEQLEDVSVILENGLVAGRFWLPRRQEIEIRRTGSWMDFPVRGIIRGRWDVTDAELLEPQPTPFFAGPEVVSLPEPQLKSFSFAGDILARLPGDVRLSADDDVRRVQEEARALVRAEALARTQRTVPSARGISDIIRVNRVEGLSVGGGIARALGGGVMAAARGRYGLADHAVKHQLSIGWQRVDGAGISLAAYNDFRDAGDEPEVSRIRNSVAAQEFGTDLTDPFSVRGMALTWDAGVHWGNRWKLTAAREHESALEVHAEPATGRYAPTLRAKAADVSRLSLDITRTSTAPIIGFSVRAAANLTVRRTSAGLNTGEVDHGRASAVIHAEREIGSDRLVLHTSAAITGTALSTGDSCSLVWSAAVQRRVCLDAAFPQLDVAFGGPVTAPGYDYHALRGRAGISQRIEWQRTVARIPVSLGRFGRSSVRLALAPWVQLTALDGRPDDNQSRGVYPSVGVGAVSLFDMLRVDVGRGLRNGRWTFALDVTRDLWPIL